MTSSPSAARQPCTGPAEPAISDLPVRNDVAPFLVLEMLQQAKARAEAGETVYRLEAGQPSTGAPQAALDAAHRALDRDALGYTEALGMPSLRNRIAAHYRSRYGSDVAAQRIAVTQGASGGFLLAFLAAFRPGARVALAAPGYPAYRNILNALSLQPVELPVGPETRFQPSIAALEALDAPPQGLILASPSNPTGSMLPPEDFAAICDWCAAHRVRLISDEIYHGVTFGMAEATAADGAGGAVVINSFSKYFSMTGWRIGWMVLPPDMIRAVEILAQSLFISPPSIAQHAALAAFDGLAELDGHVARYKANRDRLIADLTAAGVTGIAPADGAFYLWVDLSAHTEDSQAWCARLLAETGVAATPGVDFDPERGHRFIRLSFAGAEAEVAEASRRLAAFLQAG